MHFKKINYTNLNARQKETYNFQKVSAILADYGFATIQLNADWQGADFIAQHIDGATYLKVQLKGRFTLAKKYIGKDLWICFPYRGKFYLFEHDVVVESMLTKYADSLAVSSSWQEKGLYSWNRLSKELLSSLEGYLL